MHEANNTLQAINEIKSAWRPTVTVPHAFFHDMVPKNSNNFLYVIQKMLHIWAWEKYEVF